MFKAIYHKAPQDEIQAMFTKFETKGLSKFWIYNNWEVFISKYEYAKDFLSESAEALPKWSLPDKHPTRKFLGDGLSFSNGQKWITHRRIANPAFNRALSPEVVGKITIDLINLLDKIVDQPFDIFKVMQRTTIQVLGKVAFNYDFKCLENLEAQHEVIETYVKIIDFLGDPLLYVVPWLHKFQRKSKAEFENDLEMFNYNMLKIIQNRREEIKKSKLSNNDDNDKDSTLRNDLLYGMIEAANEENYEMSSDDLRDEMVTFFLAGHDKSLRLYPALVETLPRLTKKELRYGQMIIPKNTMASVNIWAVHRDPQSWPDPEKFNPERFLSSKGDNNLHAWMPFSAGPRNW
ncbi:11309_t:CDS:2 [Entrophospora sp. SA101]|nr:8089_t:CDS:2 [Entrophospora sp. SA101]CAJ0755345.1 11309_t:CDS:2 [Entrophospora sp. SA101]CAJ0824213.1 5459_t:CDS:2 [Entrophospora sp. SA101]